MFGAPSCLEEQKIEKLPEVKMSLAINGSTIPTEQMRNLALSHWQPITVDIAVSGDSKPSKVGVIYRALKKNKF